MPDNPAAAFLRRVRTEPDSWPHAAIVEHLLRVDPLGLGTMTSRALLGVGVLLPTEAARRRVAERIAGAVVRDEAIPGVEANWLGELALDAVDSLRLDGVDALAEDERARFLSRLASCLGIDDRRARAALEALHALSPEHVAALRGFLPSSFAQVALPGVTLAHDSALAVDTIRQIVRGVGLQR